MVLQIVLLILGFALLIQGGDIFVKASVNIAKRLNIPNVIIGLTVVAIGTSAPEAVISVTAAVKGSNSLAISNAIGSNMFNLLLIVGICAFIRPFTVKFKEISRDFWMSAGAAAVLLIIAIIFLSQNEIPRLVGVVFLVVFVIYLIILVRQTMKDKRVIIEKAAAENTETAGTATASGSAMSGSTDTESPPKPLPRTILLAIFGCGLIIAGGQFTVNSASDIALRLGVTERMIGLTVVALGTSLPELVVSLVACRKGQGEVALGNVIGSSIFNILLVLGMVGVITPLPVDINIIVDLSILTAGSLFSLLFAFSGQRIVRAEGLLMVLMYIAYMAFVIFLR